MFDINNSDTDITLCMFPHLREFIAIDARDDRTGGAAILSLSISNIFQEDFFKTIEKDFSQLIRRDQIGFLDLMTIPQQVENSIKANALKKIVEELGIDNTDHTSSVGILFFVGALLTFEENQLREAINGLFGTRLSQSLLDQLSDQLIYLANQERQAVKEKTKKDLAALITGKRGSYLTLWESKGN